MTKVTIRQIEVFDAVATLGSLASAADKLGLSQSAASAAINDLQIILGRPLFFHAKGKALQITDEGRRVQSIIRSVMSGVRDLESPSTAPLRGKIVVGASEMIAERLLPSVCADFLSLHPGVEIRIETAPSIELFDQLGRLELEVAFIENSPEVDGIELMRWQPDELWLVVSPDHPLARRKDLNIASLTGERWCMREARSTTASRLRWLLYDKLGQIPLAIEASNNEVLRRAAMKGVGIACLSHFIVRSDVAAGRLVRLEVADFCYTRTLSLARPRSIWRGQLATTFERFVLGPPDQTLHNFRRVSYAFG